MSAEHGTRAVTALGKTHLIGRAILLAYGGVAVLQWFNHALTGGHGEALTYEHWLRDGTTAFPVVAGMLWLTGKRDGDVKTNSLMSAVWFALVMGVGALLHGLIPADTHTAHEAEFSTLSLLQHITQVGLIAGLFSLAVDKMLSSADQLLAGTNMRLPAPPHLVRAAMPLFVLLILVPALFIGNGGRAAAQTSFPDQVIHPRGSLLLVARNVPGGMAYIAPDFGANGVRPTIEMTEGETLNITLKNELSGDISLHVHGVHYNQDSDGTRHSGSFVRPGQQKVFQWRAATGTAGYWHYHDHVMGDDEGSIGILNGLYGGLIVRKPGDPQPAKTFVIVGHDKTLNGRIYPDTPTYTAREGDLVEWIVISHGNRVHTFHLHAHRWLTPSRGSNPNPSLPANAGSGREDNHILSPGDSFGFLVVAGEGVGPGMWMYHCHFQDHASAMKGFFKVTPSGGAEPPPAPTSRTFSETGKTVSGKFLDYWLNNGGLSQQGFPISDVIQEKSDLDGKTYQVQYFERAVFELHPENQPPYDVLLSQLGTFRYKAKYPSGK